MYTKRTWVLLLQVSWWPSTLCVCASVSRCQEALLPGSVIGIQAALLYTTSSGERRINVHTMSLPVTTVLTELFKKVCGSLCVCVFVCVPLTVVSSVLEGLID